MYQEFIEYAEKNGFVISDPIFDGAIHRFFRNGSKNPDSWYVGYVNTSDDGDQYSVALIGDWKTNEKYEYKSNSRKYSKSEKKIIDEKIRQATSVARQERLKTQREVSVTSSERFSVLQEVARSDYLDRKKIDKLYGSRTDLEDSGRVIYVPCRDIENNIWGLQKILEDGKKYFMPGQKLSGLFHVVGNIDESDTIYICEGFATGASIHQATGKAVACAFTASNIVDVAKVIKAKYMSSKLIIAGDNDKYSSDGKNIGKEKAELAASVTYSPYVIPSFKSDLNKPTDFNDLLCLEGLEECRKQLMVAEKEEIQAGFIPLGFSESTHFFFAIRSKSIVKLSGLTETQILELMPLEYWSGMYPSTKGGVNWIEIKNVLIKQSMAVGPFDNFRIRGTGVWLDHGRVVINTGRSILVDGKEINRNAFRSHYVYIQTKNIMPPLHDNPLSVDEIKPLRDICENLSWRDSRSGYLLAGWIAIARISGALPIRPHAWLTGSSGSGKSTVMDCIIRPALGDIAGKKYLQGGSTEAGIRQSIQADSLPIIFDEFETNGEGNKERVQNLIELLRQAWSYTQGCIVKGSANGVAMQYALSFSALVSSIRISLDNDADRSRFAILELDKPDKDVSAWLSMKKLIDQYITEDFGERLFSRSCKMIPIILDNYKILQMEISKIINQRYGQQYGMLLAGYYSLISDDRIDIDSAKNLVNEFCYIDKENGDTLTDETECAINVITSKVRLEGFPGSYGQTQMIEMTIGNMIFHENSWFQEQLVSYGLLVKDGSLYVANNHSELRKRVFANTRWSTNWSQTLSRLHGATRGHLKRFGKTVHKSTLVPLYTIKKLEGTQKEQ